MKKGEIYFGYVLAILAMAIMIAGMVHMFRSIEAGNTYVSESEEKENGRAEEEIQITLDIENPVIRVLLMSTGYQDILHPTVQLSAESGLQLTYGDQTEEWQTGEILTLNPDDARFASGTINISPMQTGDEIKVCNMERGYGNPCYAGTMELRTTAEGIIMINELPLEEYLCKVVPSEMPASYEPEALKAQAVCARSYACRQMSSYAYPEYEAHVNDSTDYQVYNNSLPQESASAAVRETQGQVLMYQGQIAVTYYYSTSCGRTTDMGAWGSDVNEGNAYLRSVSVCDENGDYERNLPWYRWTAEIPVSVLSDLIGINTGVDVGNLSSLEVTKRGAGDVALQIVASGDKGSVTVDTENKIRRALGGRGYTIMKNDGTVVDSAPLLPSAFFSVEKSGETFIVKGGGFGHGIGMSQNGANEMAKQGKAYQEILGLFYPGTAIEKLE